MLTNAQYEQTCERMLPAAYARLKAMAAGVRGGFFNVDTMNTTALVHEAFLRIDANIDRNHYFPLCARVMRNILVDHVRAKTSAKRTPPEHGTEEASVTPEKQEFLLALDHALLALARINERLVQVVECYYFAGYTFEETATYLEVNERTVRRDWSKAKALLQRFMENDPTG